MTRYCLGFLFNPQLTEVALMEKISKPGMEWQAGLLNGIGGKIQDSETPEFAMAREFHEEAALITAGKDWKPILLMEDGENFEVHVFAMQGDLEKVETAEKETVSAFKLSTLAYSKTVPNCEWLIPLCKDSLRRPDQAPLFVHASYPCA